MNSLIMRFCLLLFYLLSFSCFFDPTYNTDAIKNTNNVTFIFQTDKDQPDFYKIAIYGPGMTNVSFHEKAKKNTLVCRVLPGIERTFRVEGFSINPESKEAQQHYESEFITDVPEHDTVFTINLKFFEAPIPFSPINVKTTLTNENLVKLTWETSPGSKGYRIYRQMETVRELIKIGSTAKDNYTDNTVLYNHKYSYGVSAYNDAGESDTNTFVESVVIPESETKPDTPDGVELKDITESSITVTWDRSEGASSFKLFRDEGTETPTTLIAEVEDLIFVDSDLKSSTTYSYALIAVNSIGESSKSEPVSEETSSMSANITKRGGKLSKTFNQTLRMSNSQSSEKFGYSLKQPPDIVPNK